MVVVAVFIVKEVVIVVVVVAAAGVFLIPSLFAVALAAAEVVEEPVEVSIMGKQPHPQEEESTAINTCNSDSRDTSQVQRPW